MTDVLHIPARLDAPIACDLSTADDTAEERLADYHRQFERALVSRERREDGVVFTFRADGGTREALHDLARREAACCPFLDYRVEAIGDEVIWTTSNHLTGSERGSVDVFLDALYALPEHTGSDIDGFLEQLADAGVDVVAVEDGFEVRSTG
ncbi:hypothetical protein [Solirubrobacter soli]|uniref:hypothetical protein n=1 Tax=Solirubrobacter soli TaxID=363832 RepID=UPI00041F8B0C|nr:hypothetical protein [Solirubrobacter soli]